MQRTPVANQAVPILSSTVSGRIFISGLASTTVLTGGATILSIVEYSSKHSGGWLAALIVGSIATLGQGGLFLLRKKFTPQETYEQDNADLRAQIVKANQVAENLKKINEQLNMGQGTLQATEGEFKKQLDQQAATNTALRTENDLLNKQVKDLNASLTESVDKIASVNALYVQWKSTADKLQTSVDASAKQTAELKQGTQVLGSEVDRLGQVNGEISISEKQKEKQIDILDADVKQQTQLVLDLQKRISDYEKLIGDIQTADKNYQSKVSQLSDLEGKLNQRNQEIAASEKRLTDLKTQFQTIIGELDSMSKMIPQLQPILDALNKHQPSQK